MSEMTTPKLDRNRPRATKQPTKPQVTNEPVTVSPEQVANLNKWAKTHATATGGHQIVRGGAGLPRIKAGPQRAKPRTVPVETLLLAHAKSLQQLFPTLQAVMKSAPPEARAEVKARLAAAMTAYEERDLWGMKTALDDLRKLATAGGGTLGDDDPDPPMTTTPDEPGDGPTGGEPGPNSIQSIAQGMKALKPTFSGLVRTAQNGADLERLWQETLTALRTGDATAATDALGRFRTELGLAEADQALGDLFGGERDERPAADPQTLQDDIMAAVDALNDLATLDAVTAAKELLTQYIACLNLPTPQQLNRLKVLRSQGEIELRVQGENKRLAQEELATLKATAEAYNDMALELRTVAPAEVSGFAARRKAVQQLDDLIALSGELKARLQDIKAAGPAKVSNATAVADDPERLRALNPAERLDHLTALRFGDDSTLAARQQAMAKIFKATPLDEAFRKKDDDLRKAVRDQVKANTVIKEASTNWKGMGMEEKRVVLQEILRVQCAKGNMDIDPPPDVVLFSEAPTVATEDKKLTTAGFYNSADGKIYINDDNASLVDDFELAIDTVMHENTHNYQKKLVDLLEADPPGLNPGYPEYDQARLFQLNMKKPGYLDGGAGYLDQPTERHAWLAGGEARKIFSDDAADRAKPLIDTVDDLVTRAKAAGVPLRMLNEVQMIKRTLEEAIQTGKTIRIESAMAEVDGDWDDAVAGVEAAIEDATAK